MRSFNEKVQSQNRINDESHFGQTQALAWARSCRHDGRSLVVNIFKHFLLSKHTYYFNISKYAFPKAEGIFSLAVKVVTAWRSSQIGVLHSGDKCSVSLWPPYLPTLASITDDLKAQADTGTRLELK